MSGGSPSNANATANTVRRSSCTTRDSMVFLPLREKTWRHAHRIEVRRVPFFPGYLFVALDLDHDQWRSVNGTIGVSGW
jgi:transcription antitermination factor NusG